MKDPWSQWWVHVLHGAACGLAGGAVHDVALWQVAGLSLLASIVFHLAVRMLVNLRRVWAARVR